MTQVVREPPADLVLTGQHEPASAAGSIARTLQAIAIVAFTLLIVWLLSDIVLLIFMAILVAVMLRGVSNWAARHTGLSRNLMLAVVTIFLFTLLLGLLYYIGPRLVAQSQGLWTQMQQQAEHLRATYGDTPWGRALLHNDMPTQLVQNHLAQYAGVVATSTLGGTVTAFVLIVTALYFAISPDVYLNGAVRLVPLPYRPRIRDVMMEIGRTLRWWSLGQLIDMGVVGLLTGIGLALLGIPLPLALAVLAGLLTFVPYFGAIAAAIPAMLVASTVGWQTVLWVMLIFAICHSIEGYVVGPLVQRSTIDLPPAVTILSMTILGALFGPLGVVLGTPVAAAALVAVREVYVADVLGDSEVAEVGDKHRR